MKSINQTPRLYEPKSITWAQVDSKTLRLSGQVQQHVNCPGAGWVALDQSTALMTSNGTASYNSFALLHDKIVQVPEHIDLRFLSHISSAVWPEITAIDHKWTAIPWVPLDYPKIEPDNWELFWQLWEQKHAVIGRPDVAGQNYWEGLCIWLHPLIKPDQFNYSGTVVDDWSQHFPKMFADINACVPWLNIEKIVLWSNVNEVHGHFDPDRLIYPFPDSLRIMLWDTNDQPTFYMTKWPDRTAKFNPPLVTQRKGGRGYGIKPLSQPAEKRMYVNLPNDTNTFLFNNGAFIHGADLAKPKIIMAIKGDLDTTKLLAHLESSYQKYKDIIPNAKS